MEREFDRKIETECFECGFEGEIDLTKRAGGLFFANPNRFHIHGECPSCGETIISYHVTRGEQE